MDHLELLQGEVVALAAALRAADPARAVRACPGWTVADLTAHLTGVHRWALGALRDEGAPPYEEKPATPQDYADAAAALVERLQALPVDAPCWTFDRADKTAGFWRKRQLQEVSVHRWDVEEHQIDPAVAEAGVVEVLEFFLPRQLHLGRAALPAGTLTLHSGDRTWTVGGGGGPEATVSGPIADLDLLLWGRRGLEHVRVDGDRDLAESVFTSGLTP